jgi:CO/xanthine dehydrogenase Mo-binding subunit
VLEESEYERWVAYRDQARAEGRHVGIGVVASQERSVFSSTEFWFWFDDPQFTPTSSPESATVTIDPTGAIVVTLHSQSMWGNSPETVVSQVVAEEFDVDPASIVVTYADSQNALPGTGPGGSRYTVMVSGAVAGASAELKDKIRRIASDKLEVAEADLEFRNGAVGVVGVPDRQLTLAEVALTAYMFRLDLPPDMPSGLAAASTYDHPLTTLPNDDRSDLGIFYPFVGHAWHIAVVEVDVETGAVEFLRYAAVHDAGTIVNPRTLDGQVIGGTVQGLGTALFEEILYDEAGRVRNETFEHYHLPSALDAPTMTVGHHETPSPYTAYGIKGAGEGGRMLTPAIMSAAIEDALSGNQGKPLTQRLAQRIGLDDISVAQRDTASGSDPLDAQVVTIGKRISDRLYIAYEQGLSLATNALRIEYVLSRYLTVSAFAGTESGVALNFRRNWQ